MNKIRFFGPKELVGDDTEGFKALIIECCDRLGVALEPSDIRCVCDHKTQFEIDHPGDISDFSLTGIFSACFLKFRMALPDDHHVKRNPDLSIARYNCGDITCIGIDCLPYMSNDYYL